MANPAYTVRVYLGVAATMSITHGDPNPAVPADSILADPFKYSWGFEDGVIPNQLEPSVAEFSVWSLTRTVAPSIKRGDLVLVTVRIGDAASDRILQVWVRVMEVTAELVPGSLYAYRQTVKGADLLADLGSWFPGVRSAAVGGGQLGFRGRLAWVGSWGGRSVGAPTWWPVMPSGLRFSLEWLGQAAGGLFALILRSYAPSGIHHAVTPYVGASYPTGYEYVNSKGDDGVTTPLPALGGFDPVPVDVNSALRYMVQPAGRRLLNMPPLPLRFAAEDGRLVLVGPPPTTSHRQPVVSADVCTLPTVLRQGREHAPNLIRASGTNNNLDGTDKQNLFYDSELEARNTVDMNATGARAREIDTMLGLRVYNGAVDAPTTVVPDAVAQIETYLPDASALAEVWTFDGFTVNANAMPALEAASVLPVLTPAYLDSERDGEITRHVTVHSLPPEVRSDPTRSTASGFIVGGEVLIADGQLDIRLTTTPGDPIVAGAYPDPITVGEFNAAAYSLLLVPNVHPNITVGDLASVDA